MWNTGRIIQVVIFINPFMFLQVLTEQGETSAGISIDVQIALNRSLAIPVPRPLCTSCSLPQVWRDSENEAG